MKKSVKYDRFVKSGGLKSGVYDFSDKKVRAFVKEYKEFIPKNEVYKCDKHGSLVPVIKMDSVNKKEVAPFGATLNSKGR